MANNKNVELLKDDFRCIDPLWNSQMGISTGLWKVSNGTLGYKRESVGVHDPLYSVLVYDRKPLGQLKSFASDFCFGKRNGEFGFLFAWDYEGHYYVKLTYDEKTPVVLLLKSSNDSTAFHNELCKASLKEYNIDLTPGTWNKMLISLNNDKELEVSINGKLILHYIDKEQVYSIGTVGYRITSGEMYFKNVFVTGQPVVEGQLKQKKQVTPTIFIDDFKHDNNYWINTEGVWQRSDNKYSLVSDEPNQSITWLHGFAKDINCTATLNLGNKPCGIILRLFGKYAFVKVGYDPEKEVWFIQDSADCGDENFYISSPQKNKKEKVEVDISLIQDTATLKVDNNTVLYASGLKNTGYGRAGLFAQDIDFACQNFKIVLKEGGKITENVIEYNFLPNVFAHYL